jgi:hypothetical protein
MNQAPLRNKKKRKREQRLANQNDMAKFGYVLSVSWAATDRKPERERIICLGCGKSLLRDRKQRERGGEGEGEGEEETDDESTASCKCALVSVQAASFSRIMDGENPHRLARQAGPGRVIWIGSKVAVEDVGTDATAERDPDDQ